MPVMNGFEATRLIRSFEANNKHKPAMIIALTGLATSRDQAEGFSAGCDIYMTKPVSFKELGKLLKNWEGNVDAVCNPDEHSLVVTGGGLAKGGNAD
jgi:CheY-like chemotaxis protein